MTLAPSATLIFGVRCRPDLTPLGLQAAGLDSAVFVRGCTWPAYGVMMPISEQLQPPAPVDRIPSRIVMTRSASPGLSCAKTIASPCGIDCISNAWEHQ